MPDLMNVYHRLPDFLKVFAVSAKGYQLRWWRYNKETERLVEEARERDYWSEAQWKDWQGQRLEYILNRAATQVPFYRDYWQKKQRTHKSSWNYLENWPVLEKESVRRNPQAFVADSVSLKSLYIDHTGGTTGKPTLIYESRDSVIRWYAIVEARTRRWHNVSYKQKWGMFGGQKIIPLGRTSPPFWVKSYGLNQLYFSVFHIKRDTTKYYVDALHNYSPSHLIVYPSIMSELSRHMLELGLDPPEIKVILCNSEKVLESHRKLIADAFKCPVIDTYGMAELTSAGSECPAQVMHFWPEVGVLEVLEGQEKEFTHSHDILGDFVMTSLLNQDMPLIRYKNGDFGSVPTWDYHCGCGRNLPRFGLIHGRANDLIKTADGRKLYILDSLFNGLPVFEAQLIQENLSTFTVYLVPEGKDGFELDFLQHEIENRLERYLGKVNFTLIPVENIPRNKNGKFRPFISKLVSNNE